MCLHTIIVDPSDPKRIVIAISAAKAVLQTGRLRHG
jgi:hypothetical protein